MSSAILRLMIRSILLIRDWQSLLRHIRNGEKGFHMIPYSSIGGDGVMKVFRLKKMCIHMDEDIWIENPLLGMSERTLSEKRTI